MSLTVGDSVAVITGASSGIARATALAFAERGASVVLAARSVESLRDVAAECDAAGGRSLVVPTDVADEAAVRALARRARDTFGRIDVWVNGAAVILYGEFGSTPMSAYRRVIETNLLGQINGAHAVLPYFGEQEQGVLINISSVWGSVTAPYVSSYVVSKFGVRAFSECLREALRLEPKTRDVHVCTILPQSVDTPIFRHAGNYTDRDVKPVPPVADPARVVRTILRSVEHPRRQRTIGWWGRFLEAGHSLFPGLYSRLVPTAMNWAAFSRHRATPNPGNLFAPMPEWNQVSGHWRHNRTKVVASVAAAGTAIEAARRQVRRDSSGRGHQPSPLWGRQRRSRGDS